MYRIGDVVPADWWDDEVYASGQIEMFCEDVMAAKMVGGSDWMYVVHYCSEDEDWEHRPRFQSTLVHKWEDPFGELNYFLWREDSSGHLYLTGIYDDGGSGPVHLLWIPHTLHHGKEAGNDPY